ncbi:hypothetical protein BDP81DRAFT_196865 [Colletotrichum phormii]|uniref:Uncharacterized protein n=1 Tax=Colletotrichum phormii TaxID=359342 RepID=A0AAI9ZWH6_9PEZI|nr:uncharacterized protein BDP81DRAFT_196865 [Colletotrichum phormii]KAK1639105.1 hypothetical protein BDP81DRAFT_196865 [Colletotrichum phormii]
MRFRSWVTDLTLIVLHLRRLQPHRNPPPFHSCHINYSRCISLSFAKSFFSVGCSLKRVLNGSEPTVCRQRGKAA